MLDGLTQHAREIAETKECWARKPLLRSAYRSFHREIRKHLRDGDGMTVELGSGIGVIKETIPECITTDMFENEMVDQTEDAYALSFENRSLDNLILFDVWHHLQYTRSAMDEFARVLRPAGCLILFEPAALSWLGRFVFGRFHHEPIHAEGPLIERRPEDHDYKDLPYYAAQGNAWKLFAQSRLPQEFSVNWQLEEVAFFPAFDWLAAGGFRARQLGPSCLRRPLELLSAGLAPFPKIFATRMLVVLKRSDTTE